MENENKNRTRVAQIECYTAPYLTENCVRIPLAYFEDLIRADTELRILEAGIEADSSHWNTKNILETVKEARRRIVPFNRPGATDDDWEESEDVAE